MYLPNFEETVSVSPNIFTLGVAVNSGPGKTSITYGIQAIFGKDKELIKYCFTRPYTRIRD